MKTGFEGANKPRLVEALFRASAFLRVEAAAVESVASACSLHDVAAGNALMSQGDLTSDIYFVLTGSFEVLVNSRTVATRGPTQHLGEMALIDPTAPRSATVRATEASTVAKLSEAAFSKIAGEYPRIWRNLADCLAQRLRQRGEFLREPNKEPRIFLGSSAESIDTMNGLVELLDRDGVVRPWTHGDIFKGGRVTIENLVNEASSADFALLTLTPDDYLGMRDRLYLAARDNVLFEFGLFLGTLGRERAFAVVPRKSDLHLPTDLHGLTMWDYEQRKGADLLSSLQPVAIKFRRELKRLGPK